MKRIVNYTFYYKPHILIISYKLCIFILINTKDWLSQMGNCLNEKQYQVHQNFDPTSRNNKLIRYDSGQTFIQNVLEDKIESNKNTFTEINQGKASTHKQSQIVDDQWQNRNSVRSKNSFLDVPGYQFVQVSRSKFKLVNKDTRTSKQFIVKSVKSASIHKRSSQIEVNDQQIMKEGRNKRFTNSDENRKSAIIMIDSPTKRIILSTSLQNVCEKKRNSSSLKSSRARESQFDMKKQFIQSI